MAILGPVRTTKEKRRLKRLAGEAMRPGYIRFPLYILLGIVVFYGFSWNFNKRFTAIEAENSFLDQTGIWSREDKQTLYHMARTFRDTWGMKVLVHIRKDDIIPPASVGNTIFIAVVPATGESLIVLPTLAAMALQSESQRAGKDVKGLLEENLGLCARIETNSATCVMETLQSLDKLFTSP